MGVAAHDHRGEQVVNVRQDGEWPNGHALIEVKRAAALVAEPHRTGQPVRSASQRRQRQLPPPGSEALSASRAATPTF